MPEIRDTTLDGRMDCSEKTPIAATQLDKKQKGCGWRYSSWLNVVRLFLANMSTITSTSATSAVLPNLLDDIYTWHNPTCNLTSRACANISGACAETAIKNLCSYTDKTMIIGILMSYTSAIEILVTPAVPFVVWCLGIRKTLLISAILRLVGCTGTAFARDLWVLYITRFLHGFPAAFSVVAVFAATSIKFPDAKDRKRAIAIGVQGYTIGNLLSYLIGTLLYDYIGLIATFLFMSLIVMLEIIAFIVTLDDDDNLEKGDVNWRCEILKSKNCLIAFLYGIHAWHIFSVWRAFKPDWLYNLGVRTTNIGIILSIGTLSQSFLSYLFESIKFSNHWLGMLIAQSLSIPGFLCLPLTMSLYWLSIIPDIFILLSYSAVTSSVCAVAERHLPDSPLLVYTIYGLVLNVGMMIGGGFGGVLSQVWGENTMFVTTGLISCGVTVTLLIKVVYDVFAQEAGNDEHNPIISNSSSTFGEVE